MDDIGSQIRHGCKLAGELEANLPHLLSQSQRNPLIESCEQVVQTFSKAIQQLTTGHGFIGREEAPLLQIPPSKIMQKLINKVHRSSSSHGFIGKEKTDDAASAEATIGQEETPLAPPEKQMGSPNTSESLASAIRRGEEPSTDAAVMVIGSSSGESFSGGPSRASNKMMKKKLAQNNFKWKNRTVTHIDEPPDDGYNWRKYGEKSVLGFMFSRSYYRCNERGCRAKKRVQRLEEDPTTLEVVYNGPHSCQRSFSIPCNTPPTNLEHYQQSQSQSISIQLGTWSSGEVQCSATNGNVHSKNKAGKEATVMYGSDSSDSSVHIHPGTRATK